MSGMTVYPFGKDGGKYFDKEVIRSIGLRTSDKRVIQISINGHQHGDRSGEDQGSLILGETEYICKVEVRHGSDVDNIRFHTNKGRSIGGGGTGGTYTVLDNIRVLAISGYSGDLVDKLEIVCVDDYSPSTVIEENIKIILGYVAPNTILKGYRSDKSKLLEAYSKTLHSMSSYEYSASVEAEFFVKASLSTNIVFENSSEEAMKNELEKENEEGNEYENKVDEDHVGLILTSGKMMHSQDGHHWVVPNASNYSVIRLNDVKKVLGYYDLSGTLSSQMDGLEAYEEKKHGFTYYRTKAE